MGNAKSKRSKRAATPAAAAKAAPARAAAAAAAAATAAAADEPAVIARMAGRTRYTVDDVRDLHGAFQAVAAASPESPEQITRAQFNAVLDAHDIDWRSDAFSRRLFTYFDQSNEGTINFAEFVRGLSVLSDSTPRDKLKLSFDMYDLEGSGRIAKWEMKNILSGIFASGENALPVAGVGGGDVAGDASRSGSGAAVDAAKAKIAGFVDEVYARYDKDKSGSLSFMEYMQAAMKYPGLKDFMNGTGAFDAGAAGAAKTEEGEEEEDGGGGGEEEQKAAKAAKAAMGGAATTTAAAAAADDDDDTVVALGTASHVRKKFDPKVGWTTDEVKALKARFDALDQQSSEAPGAITRAQFREVLDAYAVDWRNDTFLNRIFDAVDVSGSCTVQWRECLAGMSALLKTGSAIDRLELSFSVYDADGTERISRAEMVAVLQAHRSARSGGIADGSDGGSNSRNGSSSRGSNDAAIGEFVDKVFAESDRDKSGTLSLREYINAGIKFQGLADFSAGNDD